MSVDYNYFTKTELVDFLNKYEKNFTLLSNPYSVILETRIDRTMTEIKKLTEENENLLEKLKGNPKNRNEIYFRISENHEKWKLLHKKYDKLLKMAYGE